MADKNALVRGLIGGILYDLMIKSNVYQIKVDENTTLADKLQEVVTALNGKVKTSDIVNDLTTGGLSVPLSAEMGKHLKYMIDNLPTGGGGDVPTHLSQFVNDAGFITTEADPTVPSWAKEPQKPSYSAEEIWLLDDDSSQMLADKLQEIVNALNGKYDSTNPPPYPVSSVNGLTGAVLLTAQLLGAQPAGNYATEEFVERKISEAELGGGETDLSAYALKEELPTKVSQLENDKGYLTAHQDISGLLPRKELGNAINEALSQAKASGEFDGKDGYDPVRGTDYWTASDIAEIKSYVDDAILGGTW